MRLHAALDASCQSTDVKKDEKRQAAGRRKHTLCSLPGEREGKAHYVLPNKQNLSRQGGSSVVPMEELMGDLPLAIPLKQGEYVGSSGIGASQLT